MRLLLTAVAIVILLTPAASAAQVSGPVEVAPRAEGARHQVWANAAWSNSAKCWLVAWREGYLNETESDIWYARMGADGKALDPAGVRLTSAKGLQDRPEVVSDGKGFLVVWEDLRSGKDWDVYAAQISGEGKVEKPDGFLVAGGAGNQCRPDVAFAKGNYVVVWQGYANGYGVYSARVSPAGRVLDAKAQTIGAFGQGIKNQVITPAVASNGTDVLAAMSPISQQYTRSCLTVGSIDAASGKWTGVPVKPTSQKGDLRGEMIRTPLVAVGAGEAVVLVRSTTRGALLSLRRFDKSGKKLGESDLGKQSAGFFLPRYALAFDGTDYLVASGVAVVSGRRGGQTVRTQVRGWRVAPDGKVQGDFEIAANAGKDQMLPALATGPKGTCLAVYSEVRGADNVKVMARVVRH